MKLVKVTWIDSLIASRRWTFRSEVDETDFLQKMIHTSVGYLVKETKDYIALSQSHQNHVYEDGDQSVDEPLVIPKVAVRKIVALEKS